LFSVLKFSLIPAVVLAAIVLGSVNPRPEPARAEPTALIALNQGLCVALGSAFGGLPAVTAQTSCDRMFNQNGLSGMQAYIHCLRGFDFDNDGLHDCLNAGGPSDPPHPLDGDPVIQVEPEHFAALDRDANQLHWGQGSQVMLFVQDDFPVRFTTDFGRWKDSDPRDQDVTCGTLASGADFTDPDCDEDPATEGDGVVVTQLTVSEADGLGTAHVNAIQEQIGIPIELTVVGTPQRLELTPLFGAAKAIQTGATRSTLPGQQPYSTDCNFAATTDGVLGANSSAEQAVIVVKAKDNAGNDVVGALIDWDLTKFYPRIDAAAAPTGTFLLNRRAQGGVALPQTPTLDTGPLGISFPQFVCGGRRPGDLNLTASMFSEVLDPFADHKTHADITIKVVGPATDLALTAEPASIDCNGTNTATVTAKLVNAAGDPVANGLDVKFRTLALGTVNPLKADTADGKASTVVTPLSGANNATADGQPRGVTVIVSATGALLSEGERIGDPDPTSNTDPPSPIGVNTPPEHEVIERSILVGCTGGPPPPAEQAARNEAARGAIRPPDTGSGGSTAARLPWWSLLALGLGGAALAGSRLAFVKDRS
jgi:hypothetical protein